MTSDDERRDDPGEERVPIYAYPAKYRWLFTTCLVVGTLAVWVYRVVVELGVETADTWNATVDAILTALPMSGVAAVIVGVITVEVRIVVGELLEMRRKRLTASLRESQAETEKAQARGDEFEAKHKESQAETEKAQAEAKKLAAENAELRQRLEDNGSAEDAKQ